MTTALKTDKGLVRTGNEDAVGEDASLGLLVLADGMGGHNAGEVASQIAVRTVLQTVRNGLPGFSSNASASTANQHNESRLLRDAIGAANAAVHAAACQHPDYRGMGTTVVTGWVQDDRLTLAYVGDSRGYRLRTNKLTALTRDHSMVEELVVRGRYSREAALREFGRHVLARAVGIAPEVEIDVVEAHIEPGDVLLLCSDGLTDQLDDAAVERLLMQSQDDLSLTADALIEAANAAGGRDNITVALARIEAFSSNPPAWRRRLSEWL